MVSIKQVAFVGLMVVIVAACSGDDEADDQALTTTTTGSTITTLDDSEASGSGGGSVTTAAPTTTTTEVSEPTFPKYQIVSREATELGDEVIVLLDTDSYESLSDLDIHNVMSDLVEQYAPVYEAHIVETQAAVDALLTDEPTPEQTAELDAKYLARLEESFRIVYLGPLAASGVAILGS